MSNYKVVALIGKAGAGKDTILQELLKQHPEYNEIISSTTRPMREGEAEGVNYYYLPHEEFAYRLLNGEMIEATEFNGWFYGTEYRSLRSDCINLGVFNPAGVEALLADPHVDLKVIFIDATDKVRMLRQLNRENNPNVHEIVRRFAADEKDFNEFFVDFTNYHTMLNNGNLPIEKVAWFVHRMITNENRTDKG